MDMNNNPTDGEIKKKMQELDKIYPAGLPHPDILWQSILLKRKTRRLQRITITWSIAASFTLLIMAGFIWRMSVPQKQQHERPVPSDHKTLSAQENEALAYVTLLCRSNNVSCASPAFKELKDELTESSLTLMEINKKIVLFGKDANLERAKTRIENHQARLIKAMVQIL
jgi:hypothetical protein